MLNISPKSIADSINKSQYKSFQRLDQMNRSSWLMRGLAFIFVVFILSMFLPWTQHIRSSGTVTTLNPFDRPQNIQTLVDGRIAEWYVKEGDIVNTGDTILILTEAKEEYLDPAILVNTKEQQRAKLRSADAYMTKGKFLNEQIVALKDYQQSKLSQLRIKRQQLDLEITTNELELEAAKTYAQNAENQLNRMEQMYQKGIKSLTDLETKRMSNREANAKLLAVQNKLTKLENEKFNLDQETEIVISDYEQKTAKIEAEIRSTDSYRYSLLGESNKLQSKFNQIEQRQNAFVITSPITGRITKVLKNGIGEYVKARESISTIVPTKFKKAVELYINPNDMPLVVEGKKVRLQFDGWPAIVFSGWPNNSFGTFSGEVYAIDNDISENGRYRILVVEDENEEKWPDLIRIGSGARGLLLLNDVKIYYELWRQLNGFPPDFYVTDKSKSIKNKAPLRKVK